MNKTELLEIVSQPENSSVEFKRDDCHPDDLAKEMSALLNLEGGVIFLGVEDDGQVSGLTRDAKATEEWLMNIAYNNMQPPTIPIWSTVLMDDGNMVGVVRLPSDSPGKPHKAKRGRAWVTYSRAGSVSREASREEEARLYQAAHLVRYELKPVLEMGLEELDVDRLENYFYTVLDRQEPSYNNVEELRRVLLNSDLLVSSGHSECASVAGMLLFGTNPNRRVPQAGVTAAAFPGIVKDYNMVDEEQIRGPMTPMISKRGALVDKGVIDRTVDFVHRNMGSSAWLDGGRRVVERAFPVDAVREAVVNALIHRDYAREGTDVEVSLYADRLEIISPGRLPNGVTIAKMREGIVRVARNELLKEIIRDYRYMEYQGMGVRNRIIASMWQHNGTEPDLEEQDDRFVVRLWKKVA